MARRGPELDLRVPPEKRQRCPGEEMDKAMGDESNLLVGLFHDKLDIAFGNDEQHATYFKYLVDENTTADARRGMMSHILA